MATKMMMIVVVDEGLYARLLQFEFSIEINMNRIHIVFFSFFFDENANS